MLRAARAKAPDATFILADARSFDLPPGFDAVVSTFDSLNHVLTLEGLAAVFGNVRRSLRPGGRVVLDLNLREGYLVRWKGQSAEVTEQAALFTRSSFDPEASLGRMELTIFEPDAGRWTRSEVVLTQRCYDEQDVLASLGGAGFVDVGVEVQPRGSKLSGRGFFYATRRPS